MPSEVLSEQAQFPGWQEMRYLNLVYDPQICLDLAYSRLISKPASLYATDAIIQLPANLPTNSKLYPPTP
jgi:hypothetical protein